MQKFKDLVCEYRNVIRVFFYSFVIFTAAKSVMFSKSQNPNLMIYFNKNLNLIAQYCEKDQYYYPFMTSVKFGKVPMESVVAFCDIKTNGFKLVFDKKYWDNLSELNKTQLMMHEMVHCMFNENHIDDPKHFMYPEMNDLDGLSLAIQVHEYLTSKCKK